MTQSELVQLISIETGYSEDKIRKIVRKMTKYLCVALETDNELKLSIGVFKLKKNDKPKEVHNFETGTRYKVAPKYKAIFEPSKYVKKTINKMNLLEQENYEKENIKS